MNIKDLINYSEKGITSKVLEKGEANQLTLFCMAENTDMEEHTSTMEGFVYVIEGDGIFNLEGKDIEMKPNALIKLPRNAVHSLKANKNTSFLLFLSK